MTRWGAAAAGSGLVAYSLLSYLLMAHAPDRAWTVLALFGPLLAGFAAAGLQRRHVPTLAGCLVAALLLVAVWQRGGVDVHRLYVLQHAGMLAMLAALFGITLRPGHLPLITAMAEHVHVLPLSAELRRYTRNLTLAWVVFFVAMIALSLLIYAAAPWPSWSFFCTVLTPAFTAAMFVAEVLWRRLRHPDFDPVSLQRALQAWRRHGTAAGQNR